MTCDSLFLRVFRRVGWELHRRADATAVRSALRKAGVPHAPAIKSYPTQSELMKLYELARSLPHGSAVLEIGSYLGASTCFLAAGLRQIGGKLFAWIPGRIRPCPKGPGILSPNLIEMWLPSDLCFTSFEKRQML